VVNTDETVHVRYMVDDVAAAVDFELVLVGGRWRRRLRTQIGSTEPRQWAGDTRIETSS